MPFQRVPETARVRLVWNCSGRDCSNIFYARQVGGYNQAGLDALAIAVDANVAPAFKALMSTRDTYVQTRIRGLDSEYDLTSIVATNAGAGTVGSLPAPLNVSFAIAQRSGLTGPAARGRTFIAGIPLNNIDQTSDREFYMWAANADAWKGVVDGARIAIDNVGTFDPVLVSRWHLGVKRTEAITFAWTTTDYNTLKLATRRKRLG